jgi:ABC-type lipoprotein release transport system permease subunit
MANPGRTRLMIAAVAVGVGAVGAIAGAYTVIDRTIAANYAATDPAAAWITVATDAQAAADAAATTPDVAVAEARREVAVRMDTEEGWQRLVLVTVEDPSEWRIGHPADYGEAWPPTAGQIVIEQASLREVDIAVNDTLRASSPVGDVELLVTGTAHDPGRTPAWMSGDVVGFVAPQTLEELGIGGFDTVALLTDAALSRADNSDIGEAAEQAIAQAGGIVTGTEVPVPGEHPSQGVMSTLLYLLQAFGAASLIAAVALVATLVVAEIKRSTGVIAVMKTGGATSQQVAGVFLAGLAVVSAIGLAAGILLGMAGTWALSSFAFALLNLEPGSMLADWWVFPLQGVVALVVPVIAVALPLARLARVPVRESLSMGVAAPARAPRRTRTEGPWGRAAGLGARNAVRQPGRAALTVLSLGLGSAAVMAALNTGAAWDRIVTDEFEANDFDLQVLLTEPIPVGSLDAQFAAAGVSRVEYWNASSATVKAVDGPSGATVTVLTAPPDSTSATFPLLDGRQLAPEDQDAVVVSQSFTDPEVHVGDRILLGQDSTQWTVVGVVRQLSGGQDGTVWTSDLPASAAPGTATALRITGAGEEESLIATEAVLADAGVGIVSAATATDAKDALDSHLYIISGLLLVMAIGLGIVGLIGVVESMSTAVAERGGEIALLKTVGASSKAVTRMVTVEALVVAGLAGLAAVLLALPLTAVVESAVGTIFTGAPLPYTWWLPGIGIAVAVMALAATASSIVPAYEAADRPVREVLARN